MIYVLRYVDEFRVGERFRAIDRYLRLMLLSHAVEWIYWFVSGTRLISTTVRVSTAVEPSWHSLEKLQL